MTRHDPAEAGPSEQVGACAHDTTAPRQDAVTGAVVALGADLDQVAADLVERLGPLRSYRLAEKIRALTAGALR